MPVTLQRATLFLAFAAIALNDVRLTSTAELISQSERTAQSRCPVDYRRYTQSDVFGGAHPYFLGGRLGRWDKMQPDEPHWISFCSVEATGPVCPLQQGNRTVQDLVELLLTTGQKEPLTATPCDFWTYVEGRTTLLVGDSQMQDFFKAIVCTLREFVDLEAGPPLPFGMTEYGLFKIARMPGADYSNYAQLPFAPSCIHMKHGTRICYIRFNRAQEMQAKLSLIKTIVGTDDITIVNFALHHSPELLPHELGPLLNKLVGDTQLGTNLFFMETPAQHFDTISGRKAPDVSVNKCRARALALNKDGSLTHTSLKRNSAGMWPAQELREYNVRNLMSLPIVEGLGIPVIRIFNQTAIMDMYHKANKHGHECGHYCWPVPGLWVYSLIETFRESPPTLLPLSGTFYGTSSNSSDDDEAAFESPPPSPPPPPPPVPLLPPPPPPLLPPPPPPLLPPPPPPPSTPESPLPPPPSPDRPSPPRVDSDTDAADSSESEPERPLDRGSFTGKFTEFVSPIRDSFDLGASDGRSTTPEEKASASAAAAVAAVRASAAAAAAATKASPPPVLPPPRPPSPAPPAIPSRPSETTDDGLAALAYILRDDSLSGNKYINAARPASSGTEEDRGATQAEAVVREEDQAERVTQRKEGPIAGKFAQLVSRTSAFDFGSTELPATTEGRSGTKSMRQWIG